jgi:hypothetical protein
MTMKTQFRAQSIALMLESDGPGKLYLKMLN